MNRERPTLLEVPVPPAELPVQPKPRGFTPHTAENRKTRLAATAKWQPPKVEASEFWSDVPADHIGTFRVGQEAPSGDGERVRIVEIDHANSRVRVEAIPEPMPTRRELLKQRQRQRRGKLDPALRRLQRKAISK